MITSGINAWRPTGATLWMPLHMSYLTRAYAELGKFNDAWCSIGEAMTAIETTGERWCEAEVHRTAGEIAMIAPKRDMPKAEEYLRARTLESRANSKQNHGNCAPQ